MPAMNLASRDLNLLVALKALLEEQNVTRAGERLGVGQSSMSASLARLRRLYEDELLVRTGQVFEMTPLARVLLAEVRATVPLIESALGVDGAFDASTVSRRFSVAAVDYVWVEIQARVRALSVSAPGVGVDYVALPESWGTSVSPASHHDLVGAHHGTAPEGEALTLFHDRFVCLVDQANAAFRDGILSWEAFAELPQAAPGSAPTEATAGDALLRGSGLIRNVEVVTHGYIPLASVIARTDLVALVPERLADSIADSTGTVKVEPPFEAVEFDEVLYWHPSRNDDTGHRWFRERLASPAGADHSNVEAAVGRGLTSAPHRRFGISQGFW